MVAKTVTVVKVEKVKAGKTDRIVLHYVGTDGGTWKIGALAVKLSDESRKSVLAAKQGDSREIVMEKVGDYWNLISVADSNAQTQQKSVSYNNNNAQTQTVANSGRLTDQDRADGAQRGNVLTNAVNIVISKGVDNYSTALKDVRSVARDLLRISKSLEKDSVDVDNNIADADNDDINPDLGY